MPYRHREHKGKFWTVGLRPYGYNWPASLFKYVVPITWVVWWGPSSPHQKLNAGHPTTVIYFNVIPDSVNIGIFTHISKYGSLSFHFFDPHSHSLHPMPHKTTESKINGHILKSLLLIFPSQKIKYIHALHYSFFVLWELKYNRYLILILWMYLWRLCAEWNTAKMHLTWHHTLKHILLQWYTFIYYI